MPEPVRKEGLTAEERVRVRAAADELHKKFLGAAGEALDALEFVALYTAARSLADGLERGLGSVVLSDANEVADEITRERLAEIGLSKDGAN